MTRQLLRVAAVTAALGALLYLSVGSAAALMRPPPAPIGPNQFFAGSVNGSNPSTIGFRPAVVKMMCPGPVFPGRRGHPAAGQKMTVLRTAPLNTFWGFTGSAGRSVVATFREDPSVPVKFVYYNVSQPIPTTLLLPCAGSGQAVFTPEPTGLRARPAVVAVRYIDILP